MMLLCQFWAVYILVHFSVVDFDLLFSAYISLLECTVIPLLSRLDQLGISISKEQAPDLTAYMQRVFALDVVKTVDEQLVPSQSIEQELG